MRLTIVNLFLGAWRGRFGRHPCTKAPAIEPAMCGASIAADGGYMSRWRERGKVVAKDVVLAKARTRYHRSQLVCSGIYHLSLATTAAAYGSWPSPGRRPRIKQPSSD